MFDRHLSGDLEAELDALVLPVEAVAVVHTLLAGACQGRGDMLDDARISGLADGGSHWRDTGLAVGPLNPARVHNLPSAREGSNRDPRAGASRAEGVLVLMPMVSHQEWCHLTGNACSYQTTCHRPSWQ